MRHQHDQFSIISIHQFIHEFYQVFHDDCYIANEQNMFHRFGIIACRYRSIIFDVFNDSVERRYFQDGANYLI